MGLRSSCLVCEWTCASQVQSSLINAIIQIKFQSTKLAIHLHHRISYSSAHRLSKIFLEICVKMKGKKKQNKRPKIWDMLYDVDGYWQRRLIALRTGQTTTCNFHIQNREEEKKSILSSWKSGIAIVYYFWGKYKCY